MLQVFEEDEKLNSYQRENTLKKTIRRLNKYVNPGANAKAEVQASLLPGLCLAAHGSRPYGIAVDCVRGGLQVKMFFSVQQDEVYIKVRATKARLKLEAARTSYKVRHSEHTCGHACQPSHAYPAPASRP